MVNAESRCQVTKATSRSTWSSVVSACSAGSNSSCSAPAEIADGQFQRRRQPGVPVQQGQPVPVDRAVPGRVEGQLPGQQAEQHLEVGVADAECGSAAAASWGRLWCRRGIGGVERVVVERKRRRRRIGLPRVAAGTGAASGPGVRLGAKSRGSRTPARTGAAARRPGGAGRPIAGRSSIRRAEFHRLQAQRRLQGGQPREELDRPVVEIAADELGLVPGGEDEVELRDLPRRAAPQPDEAVHEVQACAREVGENLREVLQLAWVRPAGHRDGGQVGVEAGG